MSEILSCYCPDCRVGWDPDESGPCPECGATTYIVHLETDGGRSDE